jgi:steroid 5-alpha reductase family enzyme
MDDGRNLDESIDGFAWAALAPNLALSLLVALLVLAVTFLVARRVGRHAVVDVAWGLGFVAIALTTYVAASGTGDPGRRAVVLVLTGLWGVRLAVHIGRRSRGHGEDPRYAEMLARGRGNATWYAVRKIYLTQAAVMWFVSLPVQVAMFQDAPLGLVAWVGVAVWAVGMFFETVGDHQLQRFRDDPSSRDEVLDTGLWRYTRHPNYFGDACVWWGIWLVALDAWPGVLTVLSPLAMTWLLARGTGKPLLEKDIADRRPGYAEYVRRTSGFFPLPPRPARG